MQTRSRFSILASAIVASIAANTFFDPSAIAAKRRKSLEELRNPAPIPCFILLRDHVFRAGARACLARDRRDYFADLRELGGTPATKHEDGVPAVMNRAARRTAARALRYSS